MGMEITVIVATHPTQSTWCRTQVEIDKSKVDERTVWEKLGAKIQLQSEVE